MEKTIDIHNYDKQLVSTLERMKSSKISDENKAIIEKFGNNCFATGIGKPRVVKYVQTLKTLALMLSFIKPIVTRGGFLSICIVISLPST